MVGELEYGREGFPSQPVKIEQPVIVLCLIHRTLQAKISSAWLKCYGGAVMSDGFLRFSNPQGYLTLTVCWAFIPARMSLEAGSTLWFLKCKPTVSFLPGSSLHHTTVTRSGWLCSLLSPQQPEQLLVCVQ